MCIKMQHLGIQCYFLLFACSRMKIMYSENMVLSLYASTIGSDVSTVAAKTGIPALKLECVAISEWRKCVSLFVI